mmetsp:Transcript_99478/g.277930  ORF Transcript_99478/g.277930 Transcript_99478/m.277930 type:complete len:350 (+) Transcript_99478:156-1205(+)
MPPKLTSRSLPMSISSSAKLMAMSGLEAVDPMTSLMCPWSSALFLSPRGHMFRKRSHKSFIVIHPSPEALSRNSSRNCWTSWMVRSQTSMTLCSSAYCCPSLKTRTSERSFRNCVKFSAIFSELNLLLSALSARSPSSKLPLPPWASSIIFISFGLFSGEVATPGRSSSMRAMNSRLSSTPLLSESNCWKRTESSSTACSPKPLFCSRYSSCPRSKLRAARRKARRSRGPRAWTSWKLLMLSFTSPRLLKAFQESATLSQRLFWSANSTKVVRTSSACPLRYILTSFRNSIRFSIPELSRSTLPTRYRNSSVLSDSPSPRRALSTWTMSTSPLPPTSTCSNMSPICCNS